VQSSSQIITTNKPISSFFTGRMPFLSIYTEDTLPVRQLHELRALLVFNTFNRHKDKLPSAFENYFV